MSDERAWTGTGSPGASLVNTMIVAAGEYLVVLGRDVTESRDLDPRATGQQQRFRTSVESMLDAFTIISPVRDERGEIVDFRYEYANDAYCALLGIDRDHVLGRRGAELVADFPNSERFAVYRRVALKGGSHRIEDMIPHAGASGAMLAGRLIEINIVAMGENLVVSGRDVTERDRAERQIRELNKNLDRRAGELEAANREIEAFSYSVAHDLRTPLRAIAGFSELLGRGSHIDDSDVQGRALLERIRAAAGRMGELIDALLELAQLSRTRPGDRSAWT